MAPVVTTDTTNAGTTHAKTKKSISVSSPGFPDIVAIRLRNANAEYDTSPQNIGQSGDFSKSGTLATPLLTFALFATACSKLRLIESEAREEHEVGQSCDVVLAIFDL